MKVEAGVAGWVCGCLWGSRFCGLDLSHGGFSPPLNTKAGIFMTGKGKG
jgi:hypothetical protein